MSKLGWLPLVLVTLGAAACSAESSDPERDAVGTAEARITSVPNGVGCIRITAAGAFTVTRDFAVAPGQGSVLTLSKLPTGTVQFSGTAFNTSCSPSPAPSTASWTASPVSAVVTPGASGAVSLTFVPTGSETVSASFDDGSDGGTSVAPAATTWDPTWGGGAPTFSNGNLSVANTAPGPVNVRSAVGHATGKWYWEITATAGLGANSNGGGLGLVHADFAPSSSFVGGAPQSVGFGYGGGAFAMVWPTVASSGNLPATVAVTAGNVYMFALDMDTGSAWIGLNGTWLNGGNPSTGASPVLQGFGGTVYPALTLYASSHDAFTADFGATPFAYPVPVGFTGGFY